MVVVEGVEWLKTNIPKYLVNKQIEYRQFHYYRKY